MANNPNVKDNLKNFTKGDPRINRKGRPKDIGRLRELAQQIAHETAKGKDGDLVIDGHIVSNIEAILRTWAAGKNPALQQKFVEYAFGKVPDVQELTGKDGAAIETKATVTILLPHNGRE